MIEHQFFIENLRNIFDTVTMKRNNSEKSNTKFKYMKVTFKTFTFLIYFYKKLESDLTGYE